MKKEHDRNRLRKMMGQDVDSNLALMVDIDIQKSLKSAWYLAPRRKGR